MIKTLKNLEAKSGVINFPFTWIYFYIFFVTYPLQYQESTVTGLDTSKLSNINLMNNVG